MSELRDLFLLLERDMDGQGWCRSGNSQNPTDPSIAEGAAQGTREHRQLSEPLDFSSRSSDLLGSKAGSPAC